MKQKTRSILCLSLAVLLIAALLCGCGAKSESRDSVANGGSMTASSAMNFAPSAPTEAESYYYASDDAYYDMAAGDYDYYEKTDGGAMLSGGSGEQPKAETYDKIIYSGNARVETVDFDNVLERIYGMVDGYGGFLESSYITGKDYYSSYYDRASYRNASFTIRVPREAFRSFTGSLEELGNLTYSSYEAQNISTSYYDTQSRLSTYRTEEERLLEMLNKAENVEDMLNIEDRLAMVRYNIESLTTTLTNWDSKINYSTLYLEVQEVKELTKETPITRTFGEDLVQGVKDSLEWLGEAIKNSIIFIASAIPVLIIPAVIVVVVILCIRARKRKKMEKVSENDVEVDR